MADDIVTRLRTCNPIHDRLDGTMHTLLAAADEIERLRADIDTLLIAVQYGCPPSPWNTERQAAFVQEIHDIEARARRG